MSAYWQRAMRGRRRREIAPYAGMVTWPERLCPRSTHGGARLVESLFERVDGLERPTGMIDLAETQV